MKKQLIAVVLVLSMLATFAGTVAAAPQMTVTLLEGFWTGDNVIFRFKVVDEDLGKGWIKASASWDNESRSFTCNQEGDIVTCTAPKVVANKNIVVSLAGYSFPTFVKVTLSCYSVYDWNYPGPYTTWVNWGDYCQEVPPAFGDVIEWYNPGWDFTYPYEFLPASPEPCGFDPVMGDAYYYPGCPSVPV